MEMIGEAVEIGGVVEGEWRERGGRVLNSFVFGFSEDRFVMIRNITSLHR